MKELIQTIDAIAKYGLHPNLEIADKEGDLEYHLVRLYSQSFGINYQFDDRNYPDFDHSLYPDVIENVRLNFPDFGFYHTVLNAHEAEEKAELAIGDAIDDLSDIIYDVLELKWRIENNSEADGLWFFQLTFNGHTKQHLIDLLQFIKAKNG